MDITDSTLDEWAKQKGLDIQGPKVRKLMLEFARDTQPQEPGDEPPPLFAEDELGRIVRLAWVRFCIQTGRTEPSERIAPWEELDDWAKEVDRVIGDDVCLHVLTKVRHDEHYAVVQVLRKIMAYSTPQWWEFAERNQAGTLGHYAPPQEWIALRDALAELDK